MVFWLRQAVAAYLGESLLFERSEPEHAQAKVGLALRSDQWAKRQAGIPLNVDRPKKVPRLKSLQFISAVDNMLVTHTGSGLEAFATKVGGNNELDPFEWKFLSLAPDQGPDCKCGVNYLTYGPPALNIDVTDDMSHGAWNDVRLMLKDSGVWSSLLLTICAFNTPYGSLLSPSRHDQVRQCLADYMKLASPATDAIFQFFLPRILEDMGCTEMRHEAGCAQTVWDEFLADSSLLKKGEKVGLCRFMWAIYKAKSEDKFWNRRALLYAILSLQLGYESQKKRCEIFKRPAPKVRRLESSPVDVADGRTTMSQGDKVLQIKAASQNQAHIAAIVYSDREYQFLMRTICFATDSVVQWHSEQNAGLRSASATIPWELSQYSGKMHEPFIGTMKAPLELKTLAKLGVVVEWGAGDLAKLSGGDSGYGEGLENNERCTTLLRMAFALARRRILRTAPMISGWPLRFVCILDPAMRPQTIGDLRQDKANFDML